MAKDAVKQARQGIAEIASCKSKIQTKKTIKKLTDAQLEAAEKEHRMIRVKNLMNGQKYNLERITIQIHEIVGRVSLEFVRLGCLLLAVKEVEGHGFFGKWLSENVSFTPRMAQYFMYVAAKIKERPELIPFTSGGVSKAVALLDLPEDYQTEFISNGTIDGDDLDKYLTMSHKELREEVKRLKRPIDKVLAEETKALKKERDTAIAERDEYQEKLKSYQDKEVGSVEEIVRAPLVACMEFIEKCRCVVNSEHIKNNIVRENLASQLRTANTAIDDVFEQMREVVTHQEYDS